MTHATHERVASLHAGDSAGAGRGSWSVTADIRWGDIDVQRAHRQPDVLRAIRSTAREFAARSADVARMLVTAIRDVHACAILVLDLHDGLKHVHALRTYLDTVGFTPTLSDEELADAREAANGPTAQLDDCTPALVTYLLMQHMASAHVRRLCTRAEETVLAELLSFIAADEARHARIVSDLIALHVTADPAAGARVLRQAEELRSVANQGGGFQRWAQDDVAVHGFMRHVEALSGRHSRADPTPRAAPSP